MLVTRHPPAALPPVAVTVLVAVVLRWWLPGSMTALAGSVALGLAGWHLLVRARAPQPERAAALLLLLPTLILADNAVWVAAGLMAFAAALDRKHREMLIWCGVAIGLDTLGAMIVPFVLALAIQRRVSVGLWPIAPLATGATLLLARIIAPGATPLPHAPALSWGAPNIWAIAQDMPGIGSLPLIGLALCAVIGTSAAFAAWFSARPLHPRTILDAALLCLLTVAGLLPRIDAPAFLLADVTTLVLALTTRSRRHWTLALLVQSGSLAALHGMAVAGAVPLLIATLLQARAVLAPAANDNPLMARAI